ncbi:hypothetical protein GCM10011376_35960 [Nocardioides flavus (ex Wang et al. 2016)]|uniref:SCP domain-containing protein n=1 Tax=Nocardioides flavus (ex Wang et al. 2016) TaxID=2058780 RepID=A0ABQ3HN48_9ACTN|nr:CAP domain-containing protein [Nocardioides flavus (ex Wang et al. 2016)]GHE18986.1 hypothetical protein GCM10011376_35960 [Nocardioides flavus (ex Wang et al. 2016)]
MQHPRFITRLAALGVAAAVICGAPVAAEAKTWSVPRAVSSSDPTELTNSELEDALMVRINQARAGNGLPKIWNFDVCTDRLAEQWGQRIARTGAFEHRNQGEVIRKCNKSWAGETLVRGAGLSPEAMVRLWMDSPGHRQILLSPRARRAGVAITRDDQGRTIGVVNLVRPN